MRGDIEPSGPLRGSSRVVVAFPKRAKSASGWYSGAAKFGMAVLHSALEALRRVD